MSDFTIEQLEALKEGTTPAPWKFREHSDCEYPAGPEWGPMLTELEHSVVDAEGDYLFESCNKYKLTEHPGNLPLAATAPDLVDALIAEKQAHAKLRAEVKRLQATAYAEANKRLALGDASDYAVGEEQKYFYLELTRILEGNG